MRLKLRVLTAAWRLRSLIGYLVAPILLVTGFRFSKDYRWGTTLFHRIVYLLVDTVGANQIVWHWVGGEI